MTNNTTNTESVATLNENELFENFMQSEIILGTSGRGKRRKSHTVKVANMLGGFENHDLEEFCERIVMECSDERYVKMVGDNLLNALEEARDLVRQLTVFHDAFERFKDEHLIEEYEGLENCYRVPSFPADKEAA